jgi:hypothetical protein
MAVEDPDKPNLEGSDSEVEVSDTSEPLDDEFYFDGPYMVFTEAYHLRRGFCCQSGCRHCPYGFMKAAPSV